MGKSDITCLAVDLGAASGRLVLGLVANGCWKLAEVKRFRTPSGTDSATGYQCWDLDQIYGEIRQALKECGAGTPASVGVDSWGVDYVLLDRELRRVGESVCYRDKRTTGVMERVCDRVSRSEIYARTGIQFLPFNTLYQLAACVEQQPEWMQAAEHFLMVPDYLHFRLSGVLSNEYTNATTTQMCGLDGEWDPVLMKAIGLKQSIVQRPVMPATVLGDANGVKVIAPATHDTASAVAGTPLAGTDEAYISSGTWSLMGIESVTPIATAQAQAMNFTNEGGLERRSRVLKNIMGMWPIQRLCEEQDLGDVQELIKASAAAEPWRSIINVNDGAFLNPASMTEAVQSACVATGQPVPETMAELARCVFDSLALSYRHVKGQIEQLSGRKLSRIRIVGGGSKNRLLNQLCADACGLPVLAGPVEASVLGNLSAQMIALGQLENLAAARALICASFEIQEYRPRATVPLEVVQRFENLPGFHGREEALV